MRVNGRIAAQLGTKVTSGVDKVTCDGKPVTPAPGHLYLILHKPAGVLTSLSDPRERPVIGDLLPARGLPRLFPVGRLDYHTEGLVLLTNDGALAHGLMHPSFEIEKEYLAKVRGCPTPDDLVRLKAGVISDGERLWATEAEMVRSGAGSAWLKLVVHQGRYHEIRRLCDGIGHPVVRLRRVRIGPLVLGKLAKGCWRRLTPVELAGIRRAVRRGTVPSTSPPQKGTNVRGALPSASPRVRSGTGQNATRKPRPVQGRRAPASGGLRNATSRPQRGGSARRPERRTR